MAPTRSKKRKSTESQSSVDVSSFPLPQAQITAMKTRDPARTPTGRSPIRKVSKGITVNQKQALIDNLQLESMYYISSNVERNKTDTTCLQSLNDLGNCERNIQCKLKAFALESRFE